MLSYRFTGNCCTACNYQAARVLRDFLAARIRNGCVCVCVCVFNPAHSQGGSSKALSLLLPLTPASSVTLLLRLMMWPPAWLLLGDNGRLFFSVAAATGRDALVPDCRPAGCSGPPTRSRVLLPQSRGDRAPAGCGLVEKRR